MASPETPSLRDRLRRSRLHPRYVAIKLRLSSRAREELFNDFYIDNVWADSESRSGSGSSMTATHQLRATLPNALRSLGVRSLLDAPCGDFAWMQSVDLDGISYVGGDIVEALATRLQAEFGGRHRRFLRLDVLADSLPAVDAVMMRDLLLHLPNAAARQALDRVIASGATYLLCSHYPAATANPDITMGRHRFLNLTIAPFNLPAPFTSLADPDPDRPDKCLAVWRISDLTDREAR